MQLLLDLIRDLSLREHQIHLRSTIATIIDFTLYCCLIKRIYRSSLLQLHFISLDQQLMVQLAVNLADYQQQQANLTKVQHQCRANLKLMSTITKPLAKAAYRIENQNLFHLVVNLQADYRNRNQLVKINYSAFLEVLDLLANQSQQLLSFLLPS